MEFWKIIIVVCIVIPLISLKLIVIRISGQGNTTTVTDIYPKVTPRLKSEEVSGQADSLRKE